MALPFLYKVCRVTASVYQPLCNHQESLETGECQQPLVGSSPAGSDVALWLDTYRTLEHRVAKNRLASYIAARQELAIRDFAQTFGSMQEQRISADYDPTARFVRSQVMAFIDRTEDATRAFVNVPGQTRRSLAVYLENYILYLTGQARCSYAASSTAAAIFPAASALCRTFDDAFTSASISRPHKAQLYLFPTRESLSTLPQQEQV